MPKFIDQDTLHEDEVHGPRSYVKFDINDGGVFIRDNYRITTGVMLYRVAAIALRDWLTIQIDTGKVVAMPEGEDV